MPGSDVKRCARCNEAKALDAFYVRKQGWTDSYCKQCRCELQKEMRADPQRLAVHQAAHKAWYGRNKERVNAATRDNAYKRKYGISFSEFEEMVAAAGYRCAICKTPVQIGGERKTLANLDHCHMTGALRGVLCFLCNSAIGKLRDDPKLLRRAAAYLEEHQQEEQT